MDELPPRKKIRTNGNGPQSGRAWCYTLNNYTDEDVVRLGALESKRHVCSKEVGESGTPHLQGYVRFEKPQRFSWWKNQFPKAHVELRQGTEDQAISYCKKDGSEVVIDDGEPFVQVESGDTRSQTAAVIQALQDGCTFAQIFKRFPTFYFHHRSKVLNIRRDLQYLERDTWPPERHE